MKAAIYARVSTKDQDPDMQVRELEKYISDRGWEIYCEGDPFCDHVSSAKEKRPSLELLWKEAQEHEFDVVVVWKFDRFARSLRELLEAMERFHSFGLEFVSFKDQCDTTTPAGRLLFHIMGAVAEFERDLIRERVRCGMSAARERLKRGPYMRRRAGKDIVVRGIGRPEKEIALDRVKLGGKSLRDLADELGVSPATVLRRLKEKRGRECEEQTSG